MDPKDMRRAAAAIDARMRQICQAQTTNADLLGEMAVLLPDLRRIWRQSNSKQFGLLLEAYPQFARYASIVENASEPSAAFGGSDQRPSRLSVLAAETGRLEQELVGLLNSEKAAGWRRDAARAISSVQELRQSLQRFRREEASDDSEQTQLVVLLGRKASRLDELVRRLRGGRLSASARAKTRLRDAP